MNGFAFVNHAEPGTSFGPFTTGLSPFVTFD
jgi:hypothetical protein